MVDLRFGSFQNLFYNSTVLKFYGQVGGFRRSYFHQHVSPTHLQAVILRVITFNTHFASVSLPKPVSLPFVS